MTAANFIGRALPHVVLPATNGQTVSCADLPGWSVFFIYPYTGRPGFDDPEGWDNIVGAHGSTPQALAFSKAYAEFEKLNVRVYGLSLCSASWQNEFVLRSQITVPLLSDEEGLFSQSLELPRFRAGDREFLRRLTFIVKGGRIEHAYFPDPLLDAGNCLSWLGQKL